MSDYRSTKPTNLASKICCIIICHTADKIQSSHVGMIERQLWIRRMDTHQAYNPFTPVSQPFPLKMMILVDCIAEGLKQNP